MQSIVPSFWNHCSTSSLRTVPIISHSQQYVGMGFCVNQEESMGTFKKLLKLSDQVLGTALLAVRDNLLDVAVSLVCQQANRSLNAAVAPVLRSEEHTSELQSLRHLVCRLLLEKEREE